MSREVKKSKNESFSVALISVRKEVMLPAPPPRDGGVTHRVSQYSQVLGCRVRVVKSTQRIAQANVAHTRSYFANCSNAFKLLGCFRILRNTLLNVRYRAW